MSDIKRAAQLMLVAEYKNLRIEPQACALMAQGHQPGGVHHAAVQAIIAALTPPEGYVLVPMEPTEAMVAACESQWIVGSNIDMARREWAAMLAARPEVK